MHFGYKFHDFLAFGIYCDAFYSFLGHLILFPYYVVTYIIAEWFCSQNEMFALILQLVCTHVVLLLNCFFHLSYLEDLDLLKKLLSLSIL